MPLQLLPKAHSAYIQVLPADLDSAHRQYLAIFVGRGANARAHPARVQRVDENHDLALLRFQGADSRKNDKK